MKQHFNERWFKVTSPNPAVTFVVVGRDQLGWKMDVHGSSDRTWPDGDTYQDTFDELAPFLAGYIDSSSVWSDFDTGETLPLWDALVSVNGRLE